MKKSKQCPKCQSLRIGHIAFQVDANDVVVARAATEDHQFINSAGQAVSRSLGIQRTSQRIDGFGNVLPLVGQLEAYVCTECGFHETYVREPKTVPWHDLQGFTWVNPDPIADGPFR
jgi:predicted Zn-ribbon and HTH transcriptional regulator